MQQFFSSRCCICFGSGQDRSIGNNSNLFEAVENIEVQTYPLWSYRRSAKCKGETRGRTDRAEMMCSCSFWCCCSVLLFGFCSGLRSAFRLAATSSLFMQSLSEWLEPHRKPARSCESRSSQIWRCRLEKKAFFMKRKFYCETRVLVGRDFYHEKKERCSEHKHSWSG